MPHRPIYFLKLFAPYEYHNDMIMTKQSVNDANEHGRQARSATSPRARDFLPNFPLSLLHTHSPMSDYGGVRLREEKHAARESLFEEILPPPSAHRATRRAFAFTLLTVFLVVVVWLAVVDSDVDSDSDTAVLGRGWIGSWVYAREEWKERIGQRPRKWQFHHIGFGLFGHI
jgi:hypothetical protein